MLAEAIGQAARLAGQDRRTLAEHKRLPCGEVVSTCGTASAADAGE
ncbi:MAG TPA: hypothetical protein VN840_18095 [Streptosporangiaceae bacterium]|nr:hypothetical protein [Streptosporangiaceae bacterium]